VIIVVMIVWTRSGSHPVRPLKMAIRWKCSTSEHEGFSQRRKRV
jgi:hypothetical protein